MDVNTGIMFRNVPDYEIDDRTFVVTGAPRAGTTAIMRLLEALGIYIDFDNPRNLESKKYSGDFASICQDPNFPVELLFNDTKWGTWGFKAHDLSPYHLFYRKIDTYLAMTHNPTIIIPTRDFLSQGVREQLDNPKFRIEPLLYNALQKWQKVLEFYVSTELPVCLVSYEKLLTTPRTLGLLLDWMFGEGAYDHPGFEWLRIDDPRYINTK